MQPSSDDKKFVSWQVIYLFMCKPRDNDAVISKSFHILPSSQLVLTLHYNIFTALNWLAHTVVVAIRDTYPGLSGMTNFEKTLLLPIKRSDLQSNNVWEASRGPGYFVEMTEKKSSRFGGDRNLLLEAFVTVNISPRPPHGQ